MKARISSLANPGLDACHYDALGLRRLFPGLGQYLAQPVLMWPAKIGSLRIGIFKSIGEEHNALRVWAMGETVHVTDFMDRFLYGPAPQQLVIRRQAVELGA